MIGKWGLFSKRPKQAERSVAYKARLARERRDRHQEVVDASDKAAEVDRFFNGDD
jgi:hypothetical protein